MEDLFDGDDLGTVAVQRLEEAGVQRREAHLDRAVFADGQDSVIDVPHARPAGVLDHAEAAEP